MALAASRGSPDLGFFLKLCSMKYNLRSRETKLCNETKSDGFAKVPRVRVRVSGQLHESRTPQLMSMDKINSHTFRVKFLFKGHYKSKRARFPSILFLTE